MGSRVEAIILLLVKWSSEPNCSQQHANCSFCYG